MNCKNGCKRRQELTSSDGDVVLSGMILSRKFYKVGGKQSLVVAIKSCIKARWLWCMLLYPGLEGRSRWFSVSSGSAWSAELVPGQPRLHKEILCRKTTTKICKEWKHKVHQKEITAKNKNKMTKVYPWRIISNIRGIHLLLHAVKQENDIGPNNVLMLEKWDNMNLNALPR